MPPRNERIASMVRSELTKNPNIDNAALLEKARSIDPKVRRLSPRQFHATYRLPALRATNQRPAELSKAEPRTAATKTAEPNKAEANKAEANKAPTKTAARPATPTPPAAPAMPSAPATPAAPSVPASAAPAPAASASATSAPASSSKALARPHAAEREAVRAILQTLAREALGTEDRASFVRLLDSLDERANVILSIFGRH
jgi:hypothetical protein